MPAPIRKSIVLRLCAIFLLTGVAIQAEPTSPPRSHDRDYFFTKSAKEDEKSVIENAFPESSSVTEQDPTSWPEKDISPDFPELQVFDQVDPEKSKANLRRARELYLEAQKAVQQGEKDALAIAEKINSTPVQHEWQRRERQQSLERQQQIARIRGRRKAVAYSVRALETMDQVKNPGIVASTYFIELKSKAIRQYIRLQLSTDNISGCIELIQVYFDLKKEHQLEPEPYRVLAIVYKKLENMARERKAESDYNNFRRLKNENLIKYAELAYGKDSNEYRALQEKIRFDLLERLP